jgi:hypothetical protein
VTPQKVNMRTMETLCFFLISLLLLMMNFAELYIIILLITGAQVQFYDWQR